MHRIEEYAYAPGIVQPIATVRGNTGVDAVGYHVQDELGNILGIIKNGACISQTNSDDVWKDWRSSLLFAAGVGAGSLAVGFIGCR